MSRSATASEEKRSHGPDVPTTTSAFSAAPFVPRRFFGNGHLQTVAGNFLPRAHFLPTAVAELVEVSPAAAGGMASQVLCHCHWQPSEVRGRRPAVILVHGLEGSSNSQYILGNADKLWRAGASVIRMNMRNCGGTERLTPTLYHSGLSADVGAVLQFFLDRERLESVALVGYSMGGNLVVKLAGEMGRDAPSELRSVIGVSPAIDLGPSAAALHRPENRLYERRFLRALLRRYRLKAALYPRAYDPNRANGIGSLRDFDDRITALYSGFVSAEDYYYRAAAARVIDRVAVPTLLLHSLDDPFVKLTPATLAAIHTNPNITLIQTRHGGHCAFLATARKDQGDDGYWAEQAVLQFVRAHA